MDELFITYTPGAVKAIGDWELEVLGVPFGGPNGGKDSDGEYFTENTNTYKEYFKTIPVFYYHGINPDGKGKQLNPAKIGTAEYSKTDTRGHWFKVSLDRAAEFAQRIWESAKRGLARASSGSLTHLVRIEKTGEIKNWPVAELSLIDADGRRQPANSWAVASPVMKQMYASAKMEYPSDLDDNETDKDAGKASKRESELTGELIMDEKEKDTKAEIAEAVASALKAQKAQADAEAKAEAEKQEAIKAQVDEQVKAMKEDYAKANRLPFGENVTVAKHSDVWKYDNLDAGDQALLIGTLESAKKNVSNSALKALAIKLEEDDTELGMVGQRAMKAQGIKADEINYVYTALGTEWVGTAYSSALWDAIRINSFVLGKLPQVEVPAGHSSIYLPLESTDPVWYHVAEVAASDSDHFSPAPTTTVGTLATAQTQLTLSKMGARVLWSGELEEDSLIPFAAQLRQQLGVSGAEYLESAIIDGDTTATTANINASDSTGANATSYFISFDGFRHSPLATTTANSRSGGSLTVEDYLETVKLMGSGGRNALDINKVGFIVDPLTHFKTLALPELLTKDVYSSPTIEGGRLTNIWGYPVNISGSMCKTSAKRLSKATGFVDSTADNNNLYGSILAVRWDQWKFGFRRRMTMETTRFANSDSNEIVAMCRFGFVQRDTEASAITYNLTV